MDSPSRSDDGGRLGAWRSDHGLGNKRIWDRRGCNGVGAARGLGHYFRSMAYAQAITDWRVAQMVSRNTVAAFFDQLAVDRTLVVVDAQ